MGGSSVSIYSEQSGSVVDDELSQSRERQGEGESCSREVRQGPSQLEAGEDAKQSQLIIDGVLQLKYYSPRLAALFQPSLATASKSLNFPTFSYYRNQSFPLPIIRRLTLFLNTQQYIITQSMILPIILSNSSLYPSSSLSPSSLRPLPANTSSKSLTPHILSAELRLDSDSPKSLELYFFTRGDTLGSPLLGLGGVQFSWLCRELECGSELAEVGVREGSLCSAGSGRQTYCLGQQQQEKAEDVSFSYLVCVLHLLHFFRKEKLRLLQLRHTQSPSLLCAAVLAPLCPPASFTGVKQSIFELYSDYQRCVSIHTHTKQKVITRQSPYDCGCPSCGSGRTMRAAGSHPDPDCAGG